MARDMEAKRVYNRERRKRFTPEQQKAAAAHSNLYMLHRRRTDASYLARVRETAKRQYSKHREKRVQGMREKMWETRIRCLQAYSADIPMCTCCGEARLEFLTLDHLLDRKHDNGVRVGGDRVGQVLYSWLIRMGFPAGFRVQCYNCNCSRGARGYCPHELELDEAVERLVV